MEHTRGHIDGRWVDARSGETLLVRNPADGAALATIPRMGREECVEAVLSAERALAEEPAPDLRQSWLNQIAAALARDRQSLAATITSEQGKPLKESAAEVDYAADFFRFFAQSLAHLAPRELAEPIRHARWTIHHRPAGVVGLITPWNFPLAMLAKKLSAALAAGCAVVIKPSELTPLSAIALCRIAAQAGVPAGRINLVMGDAAAIGRALCEHPAVRQISFTGSTRTGQALLAQCAPHVKRLALELGGNAPFIVFDDADLDAAADALIANKFRCAGQTCVCANRVYVQRAAAGDFLRRIAERTARLKVGNGAASGTDIGPLINRVGFDKVVRHVRNALDLGGRRVHGADPRRPADDWGCYFPPTVLGDAHEGMLVFQEETFGPVVAVGEFDAEEEAIARANGTPYGLAACVFTADRERAGRCARGLHFGHVAVNNGTGPTPEAPFGGMKQSGFGREGGLEGLLEFCEVQAVATA